MPRIVLAGSLAAAAFLADARSYAEAGKCKMNLQFVCGQVGGQRQTFTNRCKAEAAGATRIRSGKCGGGR